MKGHIQPIQSTRLKMEDCYYLLLNHNQREMCASETPPVGHRNDLEVKRERISYPWCWVNWVPTKELKQGRDVSWTTDLIMWPSQVHSWCCVVEVHHSMWPLDRIKRLSTRSVICCPWNMLHVSWKMRCCILLVTPKTIHRSCYIWSWL